MSYTKILLGLFLALPLMAGTYTPANCNYATVNALINGPGEDATHHVAVNGDVIQLPVGSCVWTTGLITPAGVALTIAGNGSPTGASDQFGASGSCSGTTITVGTTMTAFTMTPTYGSSTTRLSCFALNYSGVGGSIGFRIQGTCTSSGCPTLRMDNLSFAGWKTRIAQSGNGFAIGAIGNMLGVLDHNTVVSSGTDGASLAVEFTHVNLGSYMGVGHYGDKDWAMPENWGSDQFLFMENNIFSDTSTNEHEASAGGYEDWGGGRLVVRFNQFVNMSKDRFLVGWHGTESNGRPRSIHAFEVYQNTAVCTEPTYRCITQISTRGGTGIVWGNATSGGNGVNSLWEPSVYRTAGANPIWSPWGVCDGVNPYDTNDPTVYWSGTIASVGAYTVTVSGTPWTTNQWANNYSVHDDNLNAGSIISSNTSNQLSVGWFAGSFNFSPGDTIQIRKPIACMDSAGRGSGVLFDDNFTPLVGGVANVSTAQALVPTYIFNNTFGATPVQYVGPWPLTGTVARNQEYYVEELGQVAQTSATAPFNGSTTIGMGHGTIARRPTTCTAGTGYWATDEGSWNASSSGGQGNLYKCTSTNTWTLYYTPYAYPHPLVSGASIPPAISTSSLTGGVQGLAYSQTLSTSGSNPPITCALTSGSLSGSELTVNSNCTITGYAGVPGTYTFSVTPTDSHGTSGSPSSLSLTIVKAKHKTRVGLVIR